MSANQERILVVENDSEISNLIAQQTLQPLGYRVKVVASAASAIREAQRFSPDLVITNLNLPGLSGKDLLVALSSQGINVPVLVISEKGSESDILQAIRLGATDYLTWPMRDTEIVSAVERVLKQVRARRERESMAKELQRRIRELTTIFAIGKAVTSITDQKVLLGKIVEGALYVTEADVGWLLLRQERDTPFVLSAQRNLPKSLANKLNQPWDDGISSLLGRSGEPLSLHGEPLEHFHISRLGKSALMVPVKVKNEVIGVLVVLRKKPRPFGAGKRALLESVSDYASISLVNARLFRALEQRARSMQNAVENAQASERNKEQILLNIYQELSPPMANASETIASLLIGEDARLNATQKTLLRSASENLQRVSQILEALAPKGQP